jgi:hypothetical protein
MSQLSPEARRLLKLAQRDDVPEPSMQRRVERSLGRRVALGAALSAGGALVTKTAAGARILVLGAKIIGVSSVIVGGGWLVNQSLGSERSQQSEAPSASPVRESKHTRQAATQAATEAPRQPEPTPVELVAEKEPPRPAAAAKKTASGTGAPEAEKPAVAEFPPSPEPADRLLLETNDLRRAQQALRSGDPALALRLVREQNQLHSGGVLQQERAAVSVFALCQSGQAALARSEAAKFEQRWPESALVARVRASCRER